MKEGAWLHTYGSRTDLREALEEAGARIQELETGLRGIAGALDDHLGDSDPLNTADMTDDEVREEYPILWACFEANRLLNDEPPARTGA